MFLRVLPGRTFDETLEEINSAYAPDADVRPMTVTGDELGVWDRLVQRISREVGPVTTEDYPYSLTLWRDGPAGHLQLDYLSDSASIEIPYRYPGQRALPIMAEAYRIARTTGRARVHNCQMGSSERTRYGRPRGRRRGRSRGR